MTTSITVDDSILSDLKLVKRVKDCNSMTETIRLILDLAGFNKDWVKWKLEQLGA